MIDIGANLSRFDETELHNILVRADQVGIDKIIATGTSLDRSFAAKHLADTHVEVFFTAGCHPHEARRWQSFDFETMGTLFKHPKCVFAGEMGLDYCRLISTREEQIYAFERQIEWAIKYNMPLFLHERNAHDDFIKILDSFGYDLPPVVVHCFTGDKSEVSEYIKSDFYLGITGWICDDVRGKSLQDALPLIPDNRLLVETDAPFLAPKGSWLDTLPYALSKQNGRTQNEPFALVSVIQACAHYRSQSFDHIRQTSSNNANMFIQRKMNMQMPDEVYSYESLNSVKK